MLDINPNRRISTEDVSIINTG